MTVNSPNVPALNGIRSLNILHVDSKVAAFTTEWVRFTNTDICAALYGTATAITALVERTATDPFAPGAVVQPVGVDGTSFTGNLSAGIVPNIYTEPATGWWRIRVTVVTGGNISVALSGFQ